MIQNAYGFFVDKTLFTDFAASAKHFALHHTIT
jgi:hypothetical protein